MNATRIMIRAIGERDWTEVSSARLMWMIEEVLKAQLEAGRFDFSKLSNKPQAVTDIDLFGVIPPVPKNAAKAKKEGFLQEENPFVPGTAAHARWDRVYVRTVVLRFR
jgi:hypothetical protein